MRRTIVVWLVAFSMVSTTIPAALGSGSPVALSPFEFTDPQEDPEAPSAVLEEGLASDLADGSHGVIVHFEDEVPVSSESTLLQLLDVRYRFDNIPAVYAIAPQGMGSALAAADEVAFVEDAWKPIEYQLESASVASRAREVLDPGFESPVVDDPSSPPLDENGEPFDGTGVGIAVVDSGLDASHPGFKAPGKVQANYVVTPNGPVDAPGVRSVGVHEEASLAGYTVHADAQAGGSYTDGSFDLSPADASGHGTHVAGIAAGTGNASGDQWLKGTAPGASLYSFNANWEPQGFPVRDGAVLSPAIAFDWILENGDEVEPSIEVVSAAWSCRAHQCDDLNPDWAHVQLASQLAETGTTVVFPAGNSAGEGLEAQTSTECQIQTPGVLCVGSYDDEGVGTRDSCPDSFSSRGNAFEPSTWPDLVAPGDDVTSPNPIAIGPNSRVPVTAGLGESSDRQRKGYTQLEGTSAASAHVTGIAALVLQANPDLTPAQIEHLLEETAHELTSEDCQSYANADPTHANDGANFVAGHGLVDAFVAVSEAGSFAGIDTGTVEELPANWRDDERVVTDVERTYYLEGESSMTRERPGFGMPTVKPLVRGLEETHTSPPVEDAFTTSGIVAYLFNDCQSCFDGDLFFTVERLPAGDEPAQLLLKDTDVATYTPRPTVTPTGFQAVLDEPVTFQPGDRVQVSVYVDGDDDSPTANENATVGAIAVGAQPTASKVSFGAATSDVRPGTVEACRADSECTLFGGDLHTNHVRCEFRAHHVVWTGPPGSTATMACDQSFATCQVPWNIEGEVGTCKAETENTPFIEIPGYCTYTIPANTTGPRIGGHGHCGSGYLPSS